MRISGDRDDLAALDRAGKLDSADHRMKIGLLQMTSGIDPAANAAVLVAAIAEAADSGAAMLFTPEMSGLIDRDRQRAAKKIAAQDDDAVLDAVRTAAARHGVWVQIGSLALRRDDGRLANRAFVIDGTGAIRASYDKLHLFDVDLPTGESWRESAAYAGGDRAVLVEAPLGKLGLTICYDLRFPDLFRALTDAGATALSVPSAFTRPSGAAHWHVLLRARAIEAGAFVIAAAQCGVHADGRETYGHSLVVDPWGEIILEMGGRAGAGVCRNRSLASRPSSGAHSNDRAPARDTPGRGDAVIVFDLRCAVGHVFEAWFASSGAYDDQRARDLLTCPICGNGDIAKAVMAPNVAAKSNRAPVPTPAKVKQALSELARAQAQAIDNSTWVGRDFASKARAMHDGVIEHAPIYGEVNRAEATALVDDGVPVTPLPFPVVPPNARN